MLYFMEHWSLYTIKTTKSQQNYTGPHVQNDILITIILIQNGLHVILFVNTVRITIIATSDTVI